MSGRAGSATSSDKMVSPTAELYWKCSDDARARAGLPTQKMRTIDVAIGVERHCHRQRSSSTESYAASAAPTALSRFQVAATSAKSLRLRGRPVRALLRARAVRLVSARRTSRSWLLPSSAPGEKRARTGDAVRRRCSRTWTQDRRSSAARSIRQRSRPRSWEGRRQACPRFAAGRLRPVTRCTHTRGA
jgi:hypothetical protein